MTKGRTFSSLVLDDVLAIVCVGVDLAKLTHLQQGAASVDACTSTVRSVPWEPRFTANETVTLARLS